MGREECGSSALSGFSQVRGVQHSSPAWAGTQQDCPCRCSPQQVFAAAATALPAGTERAARASTAGITARGASQTPTPTSSCLEPLTQTTESRALERPGHLDPLKKHLEGVLPTQERDLEPCNNIPAVQVKHLDGQCPQSLALLSPCLQVWTGFPGAETPSGHSSGLFAGTQQHSEQSPPRLIR